MKISLLALLLICCSFTARSQNYLPFPDSGAVWVNTGYNVGEFGADLVYSEYFCANGEDTVINALIYTKMESCVNGDYIGAFRDTAGSVYYLPKDSIGERLIYDFSAMPDDTVDFYAEDQVWSDSWYNFTLNDWDTSTIVINGVSRKRIQVFDGAWIEGVGSNVGFLQVPIGNVSNYAGILYCMSHMDTILYGYSASQSGQYVACDFFIGMDELQKKTIEVYPNPVEDQLRFDTESQINAILVSNSEGKSIAVDLTKQGDTYTVTLDFLPAGSYQILIKTDLTLYRASVSKQ